MTNEGSVPLGLQLERSCFDLLTFVGLLWHSNLREIKANLKGTKVNVTLKKYFRWTNLFCLAFEIRASAFLETHTKRRKRKKSTTSTDVSGAVTSSEHQRQQNHYFTLSAIVTSPTDVSSSEKH